MTGEKVKEIRNNLNLSQHGFAKMIGYSQSSVTNWELDYTEVPKEAEEKLDELNSQADQ